MPVPQRKRKVAHARPVNDTGTAIYGLAKSIESVAEEFHPLYHIEELADRIADVALGANHLANVAAMSLIAQHGDDDDRAKIIEYLKRHTEPFKDY